MIVLYAKLVKKQSFIFAEKMLTVPLASSGGCFYYTEAEKTL